MSKRRLLLVNAVVFAILAGSLYCIVLDEEYWPFSQYPMFSEVDQDGSLSALRLYGVPQQTPHREIPLFAADYIEPFDQARQAAALSQIRQRVERGASPRLLSEAMRDCLARYEGLRLSGHHDGPPLQEMRLYRVEWRQGGPQQDAAQPDSRRLVAAVRR